MMYVAILALLALLAVEINRTIKDYKHMKALEKIVETIG